MVLNRWKEYLKLSNTNLCFVDYGDVPTCNEEAEGLVLIRKQDGTNLSYRKVIICMQIGEGIYSWESLLTSSWGGYAPEKEYSSGSSFSEWWVK